MANRESRFDPYASNPAPPYARGVFQLARVWYDDYWHFDPFNAYANVTHAEMLWEMHGWGPWGGGCY